MKLWLKVVIGVSVVAVVLLVILLALFLPRTGEFRETFKKNCRNFDPHQNCSDLLATFEGTYVGKSPSYFPDEDYDPLFRVVPYSHSPGKTLLWEKIKDLVHEYTGKTKCYTALGDVLWGSVLGVMSWCGMEGRTETFTVLCKTYKDNPVDSFWQRASAKLAQYASGEVTAMLNGDSDEPYELNSYLASYEIPNLQSKVKSFTIVMVSNKEKAGTCENPSIQILKAQLRSKGIPPICREKTRDQILECTKSINCSCW